MELFITGTETRGRGVSRTADGAVVFVDGALPQETVLAEVTVQRARFREAVTTEVITPAAGRRDPPCPLVASGCGGCDLSHATPSLQRDVKLATVVDCLVRIGRLEQLPAIDAGPDLATVAFRSAVRAAVDGSGRAGMRARHRHHPVVGSSCRVAHPLVEELLVEGRFPDSTEVTIRVGTRTGERLVIVDGDVDRVVVPNDVVVVGATRAVDAAYHELVDGHRFRISATSFFQSRPDGADALVSIVRDRLGPVDRLIDLCAGVGLFAATVPSGSVVAVESSRSSVDDARHNLARLRPPGTSTVRRARFEDWAPVAADAVVADPARAGLGRVGVAKVLGCGAPTVALVSCDPAAMARDVGLFVAEGYAVDRITLVDLFPDTHHIETVALLTR